MLGRDLERSAAIAPADAGSEGAAVAGSLSEKGVGSAPSSDPMGDSGMASGDESASTPANEASGGGNSTSSDSADSSDSSDSSGSPDGSSKQDDGALTGGEVTASPETDGGASETEENADAAAIAGGLLIQAFLAPTQPMPDANAVSGDASTSSPVEQSASNANNLATAKAAAAASAAAGQAMNAATESDGNALPTGMTAVAESAIKPDLDAPLQQSAQAVARDAARPTADAQRDSAGSASQPASAGAEQRGGVASDAMANQDANHDARQHGGSQDQQKGAQSQQPETRARATTRAEQTLSAVSQAFGAAQSAATANSAGTGGAVAGRLSEVEASLARDRVASSLEQGILSIDAQAGEPGANAAASHAMPQFGAAIAPSGETGLSAVLGGAAADPAADLARSSLDPAPTGRLAAKGIDILSNQRGGAITMRLEPPALGQLRIELQISQGAVVADFTAATAEARVLLEANLGMLRERLESQGLAVERMTVHGGRGTESAPVATASQGGDPRQDSNGSGSDARDRGDRGGGRQDAAGGESRGRRDGEAGRERSSRDGRGEDNSFLGMFEAQRAQDGARRMRKAV